MVINYNNSYEDVLIFSISALLQSYLPLWHS